MGNKQVRQDKQDLLQIPEMGNYFASLSGKIYSTKRSLEPKELSPYSHYGRSKSPYMRVKIDKKLQMLHRVLASIHVGRPLLKSEVVNHIDGNTVNNHLDNLEVVSQRENVQHAVANNLYCSGDEWYKARGITKSL